MGGSDFDHGKLACDKEAVEHHEQHYRKQLPKNPIAVQRGCID
jgi:hypothetical protein